MPGADAQQDVVRVRVGVAQVVHVVRADQRQLQIARDGRQPAVDEPLLLDAVPLHLEEEVFGAEDVAIRAGRLDRLAFLLMRQPLGDLALQAAAQADQSLRVLREQLLVDARLVVEAFGVAGRHELDQVVIALVRLREQHEMVLRFAGIAALRPAGCPARRTPRSRESDSARAAARDRGRSPTRTCCRAR